MAIGMDAALPGQPRAGLNPPTPQKKSVPQYGQMAPQISDKSVQSAVNNRLASGYGARESAMSEMTRAGVSRGKGQEYLANAAQEKADAQGQAAAAQTESGAADANARSRQAYETMMRGEGLAKSGLLEGLRNTKSMEGIERQGWAQDLYEAMRSGQFGLDQMQLDYSPLFSMLLNRKG